MLRWVVFNVVFKYSTKESVANLSKFPQKKYQQMGLNKNIGRYLNVNNSELKLKRSVKM